jgi:hypothetical protein
VTLARSVLSQGSTSMTDREAKSRAVKILAKSIYRDLEAQGFDERQIVALATELISEVTTKISRGSSPSINVQSTEKQQVA